MKGLSSVIIILILLILTSIGGTYYAKREKQTTTTTVPTTITTFATTTSTTMSSTTIIPNPLPAGDYVGSITSLVPEQCHSDTYLCGYAVEAGCSCFTLYVYGKLLDYYPQDDLTIFKIQSKIVNFELKDTYLEIKSKPVIRFGQNRNISDLKEKYPECGTFIQKDDNVICNVKFDLVKGNNYAFLFQIVNSEYFDRVTVLENLTEYKENAKWWGAHENDLYTVSQYYQSQGHLVSPTIISNGTKELKISLFNKQDNDIKYLVKDAKIRDNLKNSIIENCEVNYDPQENTISANSTKELFFEVNCGNIECRNWYISDVYGNITEDCKVSLWGQIEFVDELGKIHIIPLEIILMPDIGIVQH